MSDDRNPTTYTNAVALWRSMGRMARLAGEPFNPPSVLTHLNEAWANGWWQEDRKMENQND